MFNKIKEALKRTVQSVKQTVSESTLSKDKFENIFWDLELELLQSNVAPAVIELFKKELEKDFVNQKISRGGVDKLVENALSNVLNSSVKTLDFVSLVKNSDKPVKVMFVGFNGAGKTTTLAKVADLLSRNKFKMVIAACDTFRAASIEQLGEHADKLGVRMIRSEYGSDSVAVAFDALKHAQAKGLDVVLIDVAGRSYDNTNLMGELEKMNRVIKPDITVLVVDSLTGSDSVNQAKKFDSVVPVTGVIVTKTDSDSKGGTVISVSYALDKPIFFLGTGQEYSDLVMPEVKDLVSKIL